MIGDGRKRDRARVRLIEANREITNARLDAVEAEAVELRGLIQQTNAELAHVRDQLVKHLSKHVERESDHA